MNNYNSDVNRGSMSHTNHSHRGHHFQQSPRGHHARHGGPPRYVQGQGGDSNHNVRFPLPPPDFQRWRNPNSFGFRGGPPPPQRPPCMPGGLSQPGPGPGFGQPQRYQGQSRAHFRGNGRGRGQKRNWHQANGNGRDDYKKNTKKVKPVKDPATLPYYCKQCDKGYNLENLYEQHVETHVKCDKEGCPYVASEKLVEIHKTMQHLNGMAQKIWKLESPEDIKKWRDERKKNFPTKENVAKKEAMKKEKIDRGEVLETKSFGKFGRGRRGNRQGWRGRRRGRGRHFSNSDDETAEATESKSQNNSSTTENAPAKTGDPLSYLLREGKENADSDSEDPPLASHPAEPVATVTAGGASPTSLGSLGMLVDYGSSSSEEEEGEIKDKEEKTDGVSVGEKPKGTKPSSPIKGTHDVATSDHNVPDRKRGNHKGPKNKKTTPPHMKVPKRQLSLLEKLLAPEIRHERNVILQCVRYIVKNDFFGIRNNNNSEKDIKTKEPELSENGDSDITFADTI